MKAASEVKLSALASLTPHGSIIPPPELFLLLVLSLSIIQVYSPMSGTVTEKNVVVEDGPALINQNAEDEGWLFK